MNKNIIVIPTYNEAKNIPILLKEIFELLPDVYVMVVDDNSPDGTGEIVTELGKKYPHLLLLKRPQKNGLGQAYITAFKKILDKGNPTTITMMDADLSHNPKYLPEMLELSKKYGLVVGSRYIKGGGITKKWGIQKKILSTGANLYIKIILGRHIADWTNSYTVMRTEFLRKINLDNLNTKGYAFLPSLKYHLIKNGARPKEVPIFFDERNEGKSKRSLSIIAENIIMPWKIKIREFLK